MTINTELLRDVRDAIVVDLGSEVRDGFHYLVERGTRTVTQKVGRWVYLPDDCTAEVA